MDIEAQAIIDAANALVKMGAYQHPTRADAVIMVVKGQPVEVILSV